MEYNYSKLKGKIIEKYGKQHNFAVAMGFSDRTLSLKLTNKRFWKQPEMLKACEVLEIDEKDIAQYFFNVNVQKY